VPFSNLQMEWQNPLLRGVFEQLAQRLTLVHYDGRGTGHSQRDVTDLSLEAMVCDLAAVIDRARLAEVSLLGQYNSCPHAIAYAARHPQRVKRMVLFAGSARGWDAMSGKQTQAMLSLIEQDWDLFADLRTVTSGLAAAGADVSFFPADLTQPGAAASLVRAVEERYGGIDLLVNNAGGDPLREFHTMTIEENLRTLQLNLVAPLALSHAAVPGMLRRGRGHIVNISAMAGRVSFPYTEVYAGRRKPILRRAHDHC